jgi:lysophospholipase L1-like esterase
MDWYEAEVRELIERLTAELVPNPTVVYGSSSVRLWSTLDQDFNAERVVNAGFGGSTLEACDYFFERIVPPLSPAALLVYAGDNDLGDGRSVNQVVTSFRRLAEKVDRTCGTIPFGFLSIKPSPARAHILDRIEQTNDNIRSEIERRPHGFFVPLYDAMLDEGKVRPELFLDDGLHLSSAGYALWTELLSPFHDRIFRPTEPTASNEPPIP